LNKKKEKRNWRTMNKR